MGSELDLYDDILPEPAITNARAGGRFHPKAKARPKKKLPVPAPSALANDLKETPIVVDPTDYKTAQSVQPVDVAVAVSPTPIVADDRLTEPVDTARPSSNIPEDKESLKNIEESSPQLPPSDDPRISECENLTFQHVGTEDGVLATNVLPLEVAMSDSNVNWGSSSGKSAGKAGSLGNDMDPFDDVLHERTTSSVRARGKFQPKAKPRLKQDLTAKGPSVPHNASQKEPVNLPSISLDIVQSIPPLDVADNRLTDPVASFLSTSDIGNSESPLDDNEGSFPGNSRSSGLAESLSQLGMMRHDVISTDDLHLEVAISEGNVKWDSNLGASAEKADSMAFVLDPFSDILPEPATSNVGAGRKFQPKVKPRSRKETSVAGTFALHNVTKENLTKEPLEHYKGPSSGAPSSEDTRNLALANPSSETVTTDALHLEIESSDGTGDWHSLSRKLTGENADIFSGLEYLDDFLSESTTSTLSAAQHKVAESALPGDTYLTSHHFDTTEGGTLGSSEPSTLHSSNATKQPGIPVLSSVESSAFRGCDTTQVHSFPEFLVTQDSVICTEAAVSNNDKDFLIHNGRLEAGPFGTEYTQQSSIPSFPSDYVSDFPANKGPTGPADSLPLDAAIYGDVVHSEAASGMPGKIDNIMKGKTPMASDLSQNPPTSLSAGERIEPGEPSRRLRKRIPDSNLNETEDENFDGGFPAESPSNVDDDNNDEEYRVDDAPVKKGVKRKSKKADLENEKPVQKRKKANELPDKSAKKPPKKFSHSTRRNKRRVDKVLLETPDDEIDYLKVPLKQLILLAEIRERSNKKASNSTIPSTNQSADNSFPRDASDSEGGSYASGKERDFNDDQTGLPVQQNTGYYNYQSHMNKTPSTRWSKQDTELFYKVVQQFGTDFSMIQQRFPDRTRNQIKLKFKKEDCQHPLRLSEALKNRPKDLSHFELVIESLQQQQAAQAEAEQESNRDDIVEPGEEDEVEGPAFETNEETTKSELKEQDENKDDNMEADDAEVHDPEDIDESDEVLERWNSYSAFG